MPINRELGRSSIDLVRTAALSWSSMDKRTLCGRALRRGEVVDTPLAVHVFSLVDALWLTEPCITEVSALNELS